MFTHPDKKIAAAVKRLRARAKKAITIEDVRKISDAEFKLNRKGYAALPYPVDRATADAWNDETESIRQIARESMAHAEEEHRKYRDAEIHRLKEEERERKRGHWSNL